MTELSECLNCKVTMKGVSWTGSTEQTTLNRKQVVTLFNIFLKDNVFIDSIIVTLL